MRDEIGMEIGTRDCVFFWLTNSFKVALVFGTASWVRAHLGPVRFGTCLFPRVRDCVGGWGVGFGRDTCGVCSLCFLFLSFILFYFIFFFAGFCVFSLCCLGGLVLGLVDLVALVTCFEGRFVVVQFGDGSWPCLFRIRC
ncbi:hypothetical protein F9C07_1581842 [Aspergillus flavus]|uniref:Transmembrane protein n=1 Tax=Aspergillus flavus (strain ATCC 200026 / FGSC A1120 / IAM 13836 / NRRL 3357 / JCM 12722 / SRRC 167) TaxID=332952 RepID=A0A7U2QZJ9_ASPFN|nr:hypothetical protein F9C07_1581842 [Aspergillus flavus]